MLTQERLKEVLVYDQDTGWFRWAKTISNRAQVGNIAGCVNAAGYNVIRLDGKLYRAGRLAWLYMTSEWPNEIDHKDANTQNDTWLNLRNSNSQQNKFNRRGFSNFGNPKGVLKLPSGRYTASIMGQYLGSFNTSKEAEEVYNNAAKDIQGEFAHGGETEVPIVD